jgi:superfamily II DNA or RNA helicase
MMLRTLNKMKTFEYSSKKMNKKYLHGEQMELLTTHKILGRVNLRNYQQQAVDEVLTCLQEQEKNCLLYLPTGAGKTETAIAVINYYLEQDKKVLFVVNLLTLIHQTGKRFAKTGVANFGVIQGNNAIDLTKPVQIASIQTLHRRDIDLASFDLVIIDECHKSSGVTYYPVYQKCHGKILGLSATPMLDVTGRFAKDHPNCGWREKRKQIGRFYQYLVRVIEPRDLVEQKYLTECQVLDYSVIEVKRGQLKVDKLTGDYTPQAVSKMMDTPELHYHMWQEYLKLGQKIEDDFPPALGFCVNKKHATNLCNYFTAKEIASAVVIDSTSKVERERIFNDFCDRKIKVIFSVNVLSEGFDLPMASVALLARPTNLLSVFVQQIGRVLRLAPGKSCAYIIDQTGNCRVHNFHPYDSLVIDLSIDDSTPWQLQQEEEEKAEKEIKRQNEINKMKLREELQSREDLLIAKLLGIRKQKDFKPYWVVVEFIRGSVFPSKASFEKLAKELGYKSSWVSHIHRKSTAYHRIKAGMKLIGLPLFPQDVEEIKKWIESDKNYKNKETVAAEKDVQIDIFPRSKSYTSQLKQALTLGGIQTMKAIYRQLALKLHPDHNPEVSVEWMQRLNRDYDNISKRQ